MLYNLHHCDMESFQLVSSYLVRVKFRMKKGEVKQGVTTILMNVYLPGAPNWLYKKVFHNPTRMRGDRNLAWHWEASWLCIITVRPPPVAWPVLGYIWYHTHTST